MENASQDQIRQLIAENKIDLIANAIKQSTDQSQLRQIKRAVLEGVYSRQIACEDEEHLMQLVSVQRAALTEILQPVNPVPAAPQPQEAVPQAEAKKDDFKRPPGWSVRHRKAMMIFKNMARYLGGGKINRVKIVYLDLPVNQEVSLGGSMKVKGGSVFAKIDNAYLHIPGTEFRGDVLNDRGLRGQDNKRTSNEPEEEGTGFSFPLNQEFIYFQDDFEKSNRVMKNLKDVSETNYASKLRNDLKVSIANIEKDADKQPWNEADLSAADTQNINKAYDSLANKIKQGAIKVFYVQGSNNKVIPFKGERLKGGDIFLLYKRTGFRLVTNEGGKKHWAVDMTNVKDNQAPSKCKQKTGIESPLESKLTLSILKGNPDVFVEVIPKTALHNDIVSKARSKMELPSDEELEILSGDEQTKQDESYCPTDERISLSEITDLSQAASIEVKLTRFVLEDSHEIERGSSVSFIQEFSLGNHVVSQGSKGQVDGFLLPVTYQYLTGCKGDVGAAKIVLENDGSSIYVPIVLRKENAIIWPVS